MRKLLCASDSAQVALRKCCRSCGNVLHVLFLYLKVAIFQPELREHAPLTTFVLKSCDFQAGAAAELPRTESRRANHEGTCKGHFASNKIARRHSESASTRTISAEGSSGNVKTQKTSSFCTSTMPISSEGRAGTAKNTKQKEKRRVFAGSRGHRKKTQKKTSSFCTSARKNLEFLHLDHADPRRGSHSRSLATPRKRFFIFLSRALST